MPLLRSLKNITGHFYKENGREKEIKGTQTVIKTEFLPRAEVGRGRGGVSYA